MDKQYKNLMAQQNIGAETTAQFYEKLDKAETRRKPAHWRAVLAAACILLIIPLTVLAVEHIFGTPKVKLGQLDWYDGPNGYSIRFTNVDSMPLDALPEEAQDLTEIKRIPYASWEEAEKALGIDLLSNTFLANAKKNTMRYDDLGYVHSKITYSPYEGQLFYVGTAAYYKYEDVQLDLKAKIVVEHPAMDEDAKQVLLGIEGAVTKPAEVDMSYEEYTTKEGIPVVILKIDRGITLQYTAVFAVNNVSYELTEWIHSDNENGQEQILYDALDGFKLK